MENFDIKMKTAFLTFYSNSFKSRAQVLLNSLNQYHPNDKVFAFELNNPTEIGSYVQGLAKMRIAKMIEILEQNKDIDKLVLLGADCELFDSIDHLNLMLDRYDCVITPHVTSPLPNDNQSPTMFQIYQTGHANADVFAIRNNENGISILKWLSEQDMKDDKQNGIFYEQTWMSALPFIFDRVGIIRNEGYNVAYFNIIERELNKENDKYYVGNFPLVIAQYSGYVKGKPEIMAKYQTRHKELPEVVLEFFKRYDILIDQ